jgi:hypothetical protein
LQIQRDIRRAIHNDGKWISPHINMHETAMRYINTRPRTVERPDADRIGHAGGEKGRPVVVMEGSTYRCEATMSCPGAGDCGPLQLR